MWQAKLFAVNTVLSDNIGLDSTAKTRQTALLDKGKRAGFMLTSAGHGVPGAAQRGWTSLVCGWGLHPGAHHLRLSDPFSGVACDEAPLSVTASQPGHSDSLAPESDIQGAARGGARRKEG